MFVEKVFLDTLEFTTDRDLKKILSTLIIFQGFLKNFKNDDVELLDLIFIFVNN